MPVITGFNMRRLLFILTTVVLGSSSFSASARHLVTAGSGHSCALSATNTLYCWGENFYGQIGNTSYKPGDKYGGALFPVPVLDPSGHTSLGEVETVTAGASHTCAISTDETAYCWGYNGNGELGNGSVEESRLPVRILNAAGNDPLENVTTIDAGDKGTCAISNGQLACWGWVQNGTSPHLPTWIDVNYPISIATGSDVFDSAGGHTCTVDASGNSYCWGSNKYGELGDGTSSPMPVYSPVKVNLRHASAISVKQSITCAIADKGVEIHSEVLCWGLGANGTLGDGTDDSKANPIPVLSATGTGALSDVATISVGVVHSCAVTLDGHAVCWGAVCNDCDVGLLGDGGTKGSRIPVYVVDPGTGNPMNNIIDISAGTTHTCAMRADHSVFCWGYNDYGQLGTGTTMNSSVPVLVNFDEIFKDGLDQS